MTGQSEVPPRPPWLDPWSPWPVGNWCVQPVSLAVAAEFERRFPHLTTGAPDE